jgi:hypothetical protein
MNERIKELWEESTGATFPEEGFYSSASKYNIEKFAELIVRECASLFPHQFTDEKYQRRIDKTIKKHFGIEE